MHMLHLHILTCKCSLNIRNSGAIIRKREKMCSKPDFFCIWLLPNSSFSFDCKDKTTVVFIGNINLQFPSTILDKIIATKWTPLVKSFATLSWQFWNNNPNSSKSYKIVQKLSPKQASPYPIYRHGKACLSKQPPWRAAGDPRLARDRSRVRAPGPTGALRMLFSPPSLPSSFGR